MISLLKLIRYKNLLMVLLTMVLTKYALLKYVPELNPNRNVQFLILIASVLLITAGGYVINDIYDVKADTINKPNKVFIDVLISKKKAWIAYFLLTFLGLILGIYISFRESSPYNSIYFIIIAILLFSYSFYFKKTILLGNVIVSVCVAMVIYIAFLFLTEFQIKSEVSQKQILKITNHPNILFPVYVYCLFSFLTTFIREIIKDLEDVQGDLKINAKTLPILIGRKRTITIAFIISCLLFFFLIILLLNFINNYLLLGYGILFILAPLTYFMYKLWIANTKKDFSNLSNLMKMIMFSGILSMLLFIVDS